ncbi:hypothetical protein N8586_02410 [Verrucomicrobiales bacterium]|nr:hypothetical protein [Verrucomicrobiales bacterium]
MGTTLDVVLLKSLKLRAVEENRPMADVISDAIEQYLARPQAEDERHTRKGVDAVKACILPARQAEDERPIGFQKLLKHPAGQASLTDVRAVLEEDTC